MIVYTVVASTFNPSYLIEMMVSISICLLCSFYFVINSGHVRIREDWHEASCVSHHLRVSVACVDTSTKTTTNSEKQRTNSACFSSNINMYTLYIHLFTCNGIMYPFILILYSIHCMNGIAQAIKSYGK